MQKQPVIVVLQSIYSKNAHRTHIQTIVINTCFLQIYFNSLRPYHKNFLDFPTKAALSDCFKTKMAHCNKNGHTRFLRKSFSKLNSPMLAFGDMQKNHLQWSSFVISSNWWRWFYKGDFLRILRRLKFFRKTLFYRGNKFIQR